RQGARAHLARARPRAGLDHRRQRQERERAFGSKAVSASAPRTLLFAPGAGAPSSSPWMQAMARRLGALGTVECFDYPYQKAGRRSPDRHAALVAAHEAELAR